MVSDLNVSKKYDNEGHPYRDVLEYLHNNFKPKSYLEIGTSKGHTIQLSNCGSISIDPKYRVSQNVIGSKPFCFFFQQKSDFFFSRYNPSMLFEGPVELAFIDGMHHYEYALRDFYNVERYCTASSVIAIHDCVPVNVGMAERTLSRTEEKNNKYKGWWTGDVWKLIPILQEYRPDLKVHVFDAFPTGLVLVTNLSSENSTLIDRYEEITSKYDNIDWSEGTLSEFHKSFTRYSTQEVLGGRYSRGLGVL